MQSQQKRVKWSRGETAEALEERTDTGITSASVELMQNCIPDIYGNVSRRPALRLLSTGSIYFDQATSFGFQYDKYLQVFPFYITENDYILVGIHFNSIPELIRIKDGVAVYFKTVATSGSKYPRTGVELSNISGVYSYRPVSYAQQNNYMLIADGYNVWELRIATSTSDDSFTPTLDIWKFSAGWYAPKGTQTKQLSNLVIPGLSFSGDFHNYVYTENNGNTTVYSNTDTGVSFQYISILKEAVPVGSIVQLPNIGCYFRIEGYTIGSTNELFFDDITFNGVLNSGDSVPSTGTYCKTTILGSHLGQVNVYVDGQLTRTKSVFADGTAISVKNSASSTGLSKTMYHRTMLSGSWDNWAEDTNTRVFAYGSLLTPVADKTATDTIINVEYGYESLMPETYDDDYSFPHPKKLVFLDQRLWAGAWAYSLKEEYALTIGSQIARYNDLKNNYNQENEPITLDILTQYKERILHLVDYNGLKVMTDSFEYAYQNGGIVKQSANGSLENCQPLVFDSLCLYVDSTGCQIKAMQYEFQNNLFDSTTINQLAPHDLVWYPYSMAAYEDKLHSTGKYLFVVNGYSVDHPRLAVCNFVPGNQANIWNRWVFPDVELSNYYSEAYAPFIHSVVNLKDSVLFLVTLNGDAGNAGAAYILPAAIDFTANTDAEGIVITINSVDYCAPLYRNVNTRLTLANTEVAVYSNGVFMWTDTTTSAGALTKSLEGLTNVRVGLPINAIIRSHPIDVGGKTKSIKKRIGKAQMSVHETETGAITINGKTGYMNPVKDHISFYGVTGMKNEIKYTITNNKGAMFHLESLLMNIEYETLIS